MRFLSSDSTRVEVLPMIPRGFKDQVQGLQTYVHSANSLAKSRQNPANGGPIGDKTVFLRVRFARFLAFPRDLAKKGFTPPTLGKSSE